MKLIGWAIVLAAAGLTPAAAQAPQAAAPTAATTTAPAAAAVQPAAQVTPPTPGIGVPDGRKGIQDQVTELGREAQGFHDGPLLILCAVISLFVLLQRFFVDSIVGSGVKG